MHTPGESINICRLLVWWRHTARTCERQLIKGRRDATVSLGWFTYSINKIWLQFLLFVRLRLLDVRSRLADNMIGVYSTAFHQIHLAVLWIIKPCVSTPTSSLPISKMRPGNLFSRILFLRFQGARCIVRVEFSKRSGHMRYILHDTCTFALAEVLMNLYSIQ